MGPFENDGSTYFSQSQACPPNLLARAIPFRAFKSWMKRASVSNSSAARAKLQVDFSIPRPIRFAKNVFVNAVFQSAKISSMRSQLTPRPGLIFGATTMLLSQAASPLVCDQCSTRCRSKKILLSRCPRFCMPARPRTFR